jgi:hypothetical protein
MSGQSGNPAGKPHGARNKVTLAVEGLMGKYGEQVAARMVKRAVDGDVGAARLILDRISPVRRGRAVRLKIGHIADAASVMDAHAALLSEVAAGKLTPEEAEPISAMLGAHLKTIETVDIDRCRQRVGWNCKWRSLRVPTSNHPAGGPGGRPRHDQRYHEA